MNDVFKIKKETDSTYRIISAREPHGVVAEQYRKLRTNIEYSTFNKELKVLNVTSTFAGEGKTVTALNLATVYAQAEVKTLIIDMDLRKPKVHRAFNIANTSGLSNIITKNLEPDTVIHKAETYLHVLPAGEKLPFPAEFLMSKKLHGFIETLKQDYDRILIDTPPMGAVTDASVVSGFTDGTVYVVASRKTDQKAAESSVRTLKENGANIIGAVLTRVAKKDDRYISYEYNDEH